MAIKEGQLLRIWDDFNKNTRVTGFSFPPEKRYSVTANFFLDKKIIEKIGCCVDELKENFPDNVFLPKETYHVTLSAICIFPEGFDTRFLEVCKETIREATAEFSPFEIEVKGLNHFSNLVFAQIFPTDDTIFKLNNRISSMSNVKSKHVFLPHSSILYFKSSPKELNEEIGKKYREISFGKMKVNKVQLVSWDLHPPEGITKANIVEEYKLKEKK